jgi:N-acetylglutamate synthase-like GNAT family acetyltransferase
MALINAIDFLKQIGYDSKLRTACYETKTKQELFRQMGFNEIEFDDAINMQLVKCQTYDEAEEFQQIKMWFLTL